MWKARWINHCDIFSLQLTRSCQFCMYITLIGNWLVASCLCPYLRDDSQILISQPVFGRRINISAVGIISATWDGLLDKNGRLTDCCSRHVKCVVLARVWLEPLQFQARWLLQIPQGFQCLLREVLVVCTEEHSQVSLSIYLVYNNINISKRREKYSLN